MKTELEITPIGGSFTLNVARSRDHTYLQADTISAMTVVTGDIEVALLQFRGQVTSQTYNVVPLPPGAPENAKSMQASATVDADTTITEVGVLRLSLPVAVDLAGVLIEQAIKSGYPLALAQERVARALPPASAA